MSFKPIIARLVMEFEAAAEQPVPLPSTAPAIWDLVLADINGETGTKLFSDTIEFPPFGPTGLRDLVSALGASRDRIGIRRYHRRLQGRNGRDFIIDNLQERLDGLVYLRGAIWETENPPPGAVSCDRRVVDLLQALYVADLSTLGLMTAYWASAVLERIQLAETTPPIEA